MHRCLGSVVRGVYVRRRRFNVGPSTGIAALLGPYAVVNFGGATTAISHRLLRLLASRLHVYRCRRMGRRGLGRDGDPGRSPERKDVVLGS